MVKELDITEYCRNNAIMSKLKAALEQIDVGNGYAVFDGLQTGSVTVTLVNDGETVHFESAPKPKPVATPPEFPDLPSLPIEEEKPRPRKVKSHEDT